MYQQIPGWELFVYEQMTKRAELVRALFLEWKTQEVINRQEYIDLYKTQPNYNADDLVYILAPHASALQTGTTKFRQDYVGPMVVHQKLDSTHFLLKDLIGRTLPDVYHVNRLKLARIMTSIGIVSNYKALCKSNTVLTSNLLPIDSASIENDVQYVQQNLHYFTSSDDISCFN